MFLDVVNTQTPSGGEGDGSKEGGNREEAVGGCTHCHLAEDALLLLQLGNRHFACGSLRL